MDIAVYDTNGNYLIAELLHGNPVRGVIIDKLGGTLERDSKLDEPPRLGGVRLDPLETAGLAARCRFLAEFRDGELKRYSADAELDEEFWEYARIEPQA